MKGKKFSVMALAVIAGHWGVAVADAKVEFEVQRPAESRWTMPAWPQELVVAEQKDVDVEMLRSTKFQDVQVEIHEPGATFLKLHFSEFNVPKGITVEVRNPDGSERYRYTRSGGDAFTLSRKAGDDGQSSFSAMSITGDTVVVEIHGKLGNVNSLKHRVRIDHYMAGYPEDQLDRSGNDSASGMSSLQASGSRGSKTESVCGVDERPAAVCWEGSHPQEFDRSWPVARLLIDGSRSCTAWRVGPENRLFTNNHCVSSQAELDTVEVWFNYQTTQCGSWNLEETVKVAADTLFASNQVLDFALFSVQGFEQIEPFGYLGLDVRDAQLGEEIYIPQHGAGYPKQIAIESDLNVTGLCQVDHTDVDRYAAGTDVGYYCDTSAGSSGSPVLASSTHRAVALHHFGGCLNSGVKMSLIWPEVSSFFGGRVPGGDNERPSDPNQPPNAAFAYSCNARNCAFSAGSSGDSDGNITQYSWNFGDGGTGTGETAQHTYAATGSYSVTLTVVDDDGASDATSKTVPVQAENQPPTAAFQIACDGLGCTFDGSLSSDSDGTITNYSWTFGDGSVDSGPGSTASHVYGAAGDYLVRLVVTDDNGAAASAESTVSVEQIVVQNQPPRASFTFACQDLACSLDASASSDPDGSIVTYAWEFGDGTSVEVDGPLASHEFAVNGTYDVTLTVVDDLGFSDASTAAITVVTVNDPPVANFTFSCNGRDCSFDGSSSHDPDGSVLQYEWSLGDGSTATGYLVDHRFGSDGAFEVRLTVSDNREASSTVSKVVEVTTSPAYGITLKVSSGKYRGNTWADLEWTGAGSSQVSVYRDGALLTSTPNDGSFRDSSVQNRDKRLVYRVCEVGTSTCSADVVVNF